MGAGAEPGEPWGWKGGGGKAWGLSQLDSPLILSKDASLPGGGRLGPDIKGPPPGRFPGNLVKEWEAGEDREPLPGA